MNKYDMKYVFKRVLSFFIIFILLSFFKSCEVHAETYNLDSSQVTSYYRVNNATLINLNYNTWYGIGNNILTNLRLGFTPLNPKTCTEYNACSEGLQPGQYLFDFYVLTDGGVNINNCNQLSSDFQNVNMTTGNWVSNQITSSCVDVSTYVESGYATYLHILYSFTSSAFATEYRFYFNYGSGWLSGSSQFKVLLGNVYDFDQTIINDFKQQKLNEQQINQNNTIINQNSTIINNQNTINNSIQQQTQAQQDTNNILNNDNVDGANSEVDSLLQNNAFNDSSGIQSIINAPLNFINGLTNSCSPISINIPYINSNLTIPCIKQELTNHVPTIVPILSTAINGFIIYRILIDIVYLIKSARNPDDDRIEVLDL